MAKRKSDQEFSNEHELFLSRIRKGKHALEIASELNLSQPQFNSHLLQAYDYGEIHTGDYKPSYEMVKKKSFPKKIWEIFAQFYQFPVDDNALVKITACDGGILLSIHTAMSPKNMADKNEIVVTDTQDTDSSGSISVTSPQSEIPATQETLDDHVEESTSVER
jgi:hypothetical protein